MAKTFNISFKFNLTDNMTVPLKGLSASMTGLARTAGAASASVGRMSSGTGSIFKGIIGAQLFTYGLTKLSFGFQKVIGEASKMEDSLMTFTTLLGGSDAAAKKLVGDLQKLGARTPFEYNDLSDATSTLMGFGAATKDTAVSILTQLGDIAQGSAPRLQRIALAYGQIMAGGKANFQDMNQLINNQVPILQELGKMWGVPIGKVREMVIAGKATSAEVQKAFEKMTSKGGLFYKGMERASSTFAGRMSTLQDAINMTAAGIGTALLPMMKDLVMATTVMAEKILRWVNENKALINTLATGLIKFLGIFFSIIATGIGLVWKLRYFILFLSAALLIYKGTMLAIIAIQWIQYLRMMWPLIKSVTASQWAWNIALTANPIGILVVALAAAVGWIVYLNYNIQKMNNLFMELTSILDNPIFAALFSAIPGMDNMIRLRTMNKEAMEAKAASKGALGKSETDIKLKVTAEGGAQVKTESVKKKGSQKVELNTNNGSILGWG